MSAQQNQPQVTDPVVPPRISNEPTKRGCGRIALIGCGVLIVLALLVAGGVGAIMYFGGRSVEPYVTKYFDHINKGEYDAIYDESHPAMKETVTREGLVDFLKVVHGALGGFKSKSLKGIEVNSENGVSTAVARYNVTFEKGEAEVVLKFRGEGDAWKLMLVDYNSPLLDVTYHGSGSV